LLRLVSLAAASGFHAHAWQLQWTLAGFYHQRGCWGVQQEALAADRGGDGLQARN
jgi:hypothetical protein